MRSAGAAMGFARESFGGGAGAPASARVTEVTPTVFGAGAGRAADAFAAESTDLGGRTALLADHDTRADHQLRDALAAAGTGRDRMDAVIEAAVADVSAVGASTDTPEGRRALIAAIRRHLEDTAATLDGAGADAATRAASAVATAAAYDGIGRPPGPPVLPTAMTPPPVMPMPGPLAMPALPTGGGTPGGGFPLGALTGLPGLLTGAAHPPPASGTPAGPTASTTAIDAGGSKAAAIPLREVRFERHGQPGGRAAYRSYIGAALDVMGVRDPVARARWVSGLETALARESSFHPLAVNRHDSNAVGSPAPDGAPSGSARGGLQTIPATFASNHQPGTSTNIYDPVANIAAAMNYLMRRYHVRRDGSNLVSVPQFDPHQNGRGY